MKLVGLIALSLCAASIAQKPMRADFGDTAVDIIAQCRPPTAPPPGKVLDLTHYLMCRSYLEGFVEAGSSAARDRTDFPVCLEGVSPGQLALLIVKYGDDHPERLHWSRYRFVTAALSSAFPCKAAPRR